MLSWTAMPSRRNSGFQASSTWSPAGARSLRRVVSRRAGPTGTAGVPPPRPPRGGGGEPAGGADRDRGLPDHEAPAGEVRAERVNGRLNVLQVGRPVPRLGGPDAQ